MTDNAATRVDRENSPISGNVRSMVKPSQGDRLEWLFREALRRQQVHPLRELLRRYRSREGA